METYTVKVHSTYTVWYKPNTNQLHRLDGPAIERNDGNKEWWVEGKRHRLDGPAIEYSDGHKEWWVDGKLHRLDGPAIEYSNGEKEWWVDGKKLTESEFNKRDQSCKGKIVEIDGKKYHLEEI